MSDGSRLHAVGIGSMVVDRVYRTPRILGEDEKGLLRADANGEALGLHVGGVVLNAIGWAAALGLRTGVFGRQADDESGRFLRAAMRRCGIEAHIVIEGASSSFAEIFVDDAGGRAIYMHPATTAGTTPEHVRAHHAEFIARAERLNTEVSQLPLDAALEALRIARSVGVETWLDLDIPPSDAVGVLGEESTLMEMLTQADVLKPSKSAAGELVDTTGPGDGALGIARALRRRFGNRVVAVTDGDRGCAISSDEFEGSVPTRVVEALDSTGCGDAFLGGMMAGRHYGLKWREAAELGNACGAACATQLGAFPEDSEMARATALEGVAESLRELDGIRELYGLRGAPAAPTAQSGVSATTEPAAAAIRALEVGAVELASLARRADAGAYARAAAVVEAAHSRGGRLHVTGVGKPEHLARYAASLLSSTGTPASFLHATEALHGSLGQLLEADVVVAISNSGSTPELMAAVEAIRSRGPRLIAVTGVADSELARAAEVVLDARVAEEGGPLGLAPRASAAAQLLAVAALAAELQQRCGFTSEDYAARHPAGVLGRRARLLDDPSS